MLTGPVSGGGLDGYVGPVTGEKTATARLVFDVTVDDTARALGSGDVDVLATPRLLAWCEAATCAAVATATAVADPDAAAGTSATDAAAGTTTVGTRVLLEHLLATPVGGQVTVRARLAGVHGRRLRFEVSATDRHGDVIAAGEVTRVVLDRDRFNGRIPSP